MQTNSQLSLFVPGMVLDPSINRVFTAKEVKNNKGETVGTSIMALSAKDLPIELRGKVHKQMRERVTLEASDAALRMAKGEFSALPDSFTFKSVSNRKGKDGLRTITFKVREVIRFKAPEVEAMAKALGLSIDAVKEMASAQAKKLAEAATEVESESTLQNEGEALPDDVRQADAEYLAEMAKLEAEEAAAAK